MKSPKNKQMENVIDSGYIKREAEKHKRLSEAIKTIREYLSYSPVSNQIIDELCCEMENTEIDVIEYIFGKDKSKLIFQYKMEKEKLPF